MVSRAFWGASGRIWSRTSPRAEGDAVEDTVDEAGALGASADEKVSVRTEAGVGAAGGGVCGVGAGFFSGAAFNDFCGADGFGDGGVAARRAGGEAGVADDSDEVEAGAAVEAEEEESERWPRIFGSAKMATITRRAAATGTT